MIELIKERSYTRKVFDLGGGKKNYHFHTAHQYYKDSGGLYLPINTALSFNNNSNVWRQDKASYACEIPLYADSPFVFHNQFEGTDHDIVAIPVCAHVQGISNYSSSEGNTVLYKDAFGKGIDLKVYAYWHGLKKVIIINKKPTDLKDLIFDFELILPVNAMVKGSNNMEWNKIDRLDFKDRVLKIGDEGKESYFNSASMWDSSYRHKKINRVGIELYVRDGKTYLRKIIPKEFLEEAIYPVYTDHPTNYASTVGDGFVGLSFMSTWNEVHDLENSGNYATQETNYVFSGFDSDASDFSIGRYFVPINTDGIVGTISSALLNIYVLFIGDDDNDGNDWVNVVQTSQSNTDSLEGNDYVKCGAVDNPIEGATRIDLTAGFTVDTFNAFTLNATGIGWINKTGVTKLGLREGHDAIDHAILSSGMIWDELDISGSEKITDPSQDPYLDVTTGAAAWVRGGKVKCIL